MLHRSATIALLAQTASRLPIGRRASVRFASSSVGDTSNRNGVLFITSRRDVAGANLANTLLSSGGTCWSALSPSRCPAGGEAAKWLASDESDLLEANIWLIDDSLTLADDLDLQWAASSPTRALPEDVIFLSRHASKSAKKCLTVHPIGNPTLLADSLPKLGGRAGQIPPPSPRMADLLRAARARMKADPELADFTVCPEATHHGPWLESPCCFVEIGSAAEDWSRADAAECWADVLLSTVLRNCNKAAKLSFGSNAEDDAAAATSPVVLIGVGGGHYAPKVWDVVSANPHVMLGHMVSNYALEFVDSRDDHSTLGGGWRATITEAVRSTRAAYGEASDDDQKPATVELVALVDKKAFKSAQRAQLTSLLEELGVRVALSKNAVLTPEPQ